MDIDAVLKTLDQRSSALMQAEGIKKADITHFADVCYIGQSYHLEVPLDVIDAAGICDAFLAAHARVYGHSTAVPAKIANLRTVHQAFAGPSRPAPPRRSHSRHPTMRSIRMGNGSVQAAIWRHGAMKAGVPVPGPAVIDQADTTTLVEPGGTARIADGQ